MENPVPLQSIIGVDKNNPHFTVCKHPQKASKLLVFFGAALLETVDEDQDNPAFKLLLARLYNAQIKRKILVESFGVALTTLRRWGDALNGDDPERLIRVIAGRQHPRKLTPEIVGFAEKRFSHIYPENRYSYSKQIREEIQATFEVSLSAETLRPYFTKCKFLLIDDAQQKTHSSVSDENECTFGTGGVKPSEEDESSAVGTLACLPEPELQNNPPEQSLTVPGTSQNLDGFEPGECLSGNLRVQKAQPVAPNTPNRKQTISSSTEPAYHFCHHAGILLFSGYLQQLVAGLGETAVLTKQWLAAVLLGATNIEKSKLLDWNSLQYLLGDVVANLNRQRQALGELAMADVLESLLRFNGDWVDIQQCHDFYYDPHSKHYTGAKKVLKGWCARLRFAEKVLHMDFIHTVTGEPVYIVHDDNYLDLRERFFHVILAFRVQFAFDMQTALTFVVDRGLYSLDVFKKIIDDQAITYFVTWEKGYQGDLQQAREWTGNLSILRPRNNHQDNKRFDFQYLDELWPRCDTIRRLIVRATNPNGNCIEVSILSNDLDRCANELITLMFSRWLQENDFKYLDIHFGINEITAYASISYKELSKSIEDKQIKSGQYKSLEKQRLALKKQLKNRLLQQHTAKRSNKKREEDIKKLTTQLQELELEMASTEKEVSRLEDLTEQNFRKLDSTKKALMDGIKITARNLFYLLLQPFKKAYNNYRDDHVLFRHLTRSHGFLCDRGAVMEVLLFPEARFPPKVMGIFNDMLEELNSWKLVIPNGSGKTLYFRLIQKESILFCIAEDS